VDPENIARHAESGRTLVGWNVLVETQYEIDRDGVVAKRQVVAEPGTPDVDVRQTPGLFTEEVIGKDGRLGAVHVDARRAEVRPLLPLPLFETAVDQNHVVMSIATLAVLPGVRFVVNATPSSSFDVMRSSPVDAEFGWPSCSPSMSCPILYASVNA